jgi:hypothetical protein
VKLIKQVRLEFRQGTSDKVYEVDLCEVGAGQYVVNFRYGRRGTALRDSSKTAAPVPLEKAQTIFNQLVASKRGEGYVEYGTSTAPAPSPTAAPAPPAASPQEPVLEALPVEGREGAVLSRLFDGFEGGSRPVSGKGSWRLSRAIWRVGELGLRAAEPLLLRLVEQTQQRKAQRQQQPLRSQFAPDEFKQILGNTIPIPRHAWRVARWSATFAPPEDVLLYVLAWSLGRCGAAASIPILQQLRTETWEPIGRIATASLLLLLDEPQRGHLIQELSALLPGPLAPLSRTGPADAFRQALQEYLARTNALATSVLDSLYLIDNQHVRPTLLEVLRTVPFQSAYFQTVRHMFKVAELRRDAEVFSLLAHRFETNAENLGNYWTEVVFIQYRQGQREHARSRVCPFGKATRRYLRLRCWRTLRRLGELGDPDYVRLAAGVLLAFTDADAHAAESWTHWEYTTTRWGGLRRTGSRQRYRDRFGRYWAFCQILYRHSPRYEPVERKGTFLCRGTYKPGDTILPQREEAFPQLWEAAPEALLRLLLESRCQPVHEFAALAMRACPDFCRQLPVATLVRLLAASYAATLDLALELAVQRYDPARPDHELVLALANAGLERARQQARQWIDAQREHFVQDQAFLAALAGSPQADTRAFARQWLQQIAFTPDAAEALIGRLIALLRSFTAEEGGRASDTTQTLLLVFAGPLRHLGVDVIRDLLAHPLPEVRRFAGEVLLTHETLSGQPPEDVLLRLLQDAEMSVRSLGVRLFGQLPDGMLKENLDLLVGLSRHELPEFRANIRPVVQRLAAADPAFGRRFAERLVEALLVPGAPEGIPSYTARLLREDLREYLGSVPAATIWKLLQSRSPPAQEVGGLLLASNVRPQDLSVTEIAKLASHDILAVREAAWQMCRASLDRLKADMDTASRLVDAKWEDSRQFAFELLRDAFGRGELTPAILVSLCDSVRPDVQQFGREMITRLFEDQDGPELALKLSEHPSTSMQMFTANFLERYVGSDPSRLRDLTWYFQSVLSRVNQGRVARERVFAFLEKAAAASEECAAAVAAILGRQSATAAIGDRGRAIAILTRIHAAYPAVAMPFRVRPVEVRHGV